MSDSNSPPLAGPDLEQGVSWNELADGAMLLGHAQGEPVLLARTGDEVLAIGAVCTHYGAMLTDGLLVGDTVRCPWHHACFSLRTGDAVRPPALKPVASWVVERRGDRVVVTGKRPEVDAGGPPRETTYPGFPRSASPSPRPAAPSRARPEAPDSVVIVGAGAAGNAAAVQLRHEGYSGALTVFGAETALPYDRPNLSKDYLAGTAPEEWLPLRSEAFYRDHGIELALGMRVAALDLKLRRVILADGSERRYDRLVLATGADPVHLRISGAQLPHVHYLRTVADSRAIIRAAEGAKCAVVLGASFIGLEVAASLRARGLAVHVVGPEHRPLERVFGPEVGAAIQKWHEAHGVVFHLGLTAAGIGHSIIHFTDGSSLPADLVVVGIGVRAATSLAAAAGLALDNGIPVDELLRTSVPDVFAAGDIARWPDPHTGERIRVEHWVVAERQGRTAARNVLGAAEPFTAVPFFWSQHYDRTLSYVGHAMRWNAVDVDGDLEAADFRVTYRLGERVLAVATAGRDRESLEAELMLERGGGGIEDVARADEAALVPRARRAG